MESLRCSPVTGRQGGRSRRVLWAIKRFTQRNKNVGRPLSPNRKVDVAFYPSYRRDLAEIPFKHWRANRPSAGITPSSRLQMVSVPTTESEAANMFPKGGRVALLTFAIFVLPRVGATEPAKWPCQGRCIDAAWISNKGYAYFAKGNQFWRYDIARDKVSFVEVWDNYPMPMRVWSGFPQAWSTGIDTAL